jgi:hypothetical protein
MDRGASRDDYGSQTGDEPNPREDEQHATLDSLN